MWSLHGVYVGSLRVLWLPPTVQKKCMLGWLIGDSKLPVGVSVNIDGCVSHLCLCGPVMAWLPGVPCLSPNDSWDRLQPPMTLNWNKRV